MKTEKTLASWDTIFDYDLDACRDENTLLERKIRDLSSQLETCVEGKSNNKKEIENYIIKIKFLEKERDSYLETSNDYQQLKIKLEKDLEIVKQEKQSLVDENEKFGDVIKQLKEKNNKFLKDKEQLKTNITKLDQKIDQYIKVKNSLIEKFKQLRDEDIQAREQLTKQIGDYQTLIKESEQYKQLLVNDLNSYINAFEEITAEKQKLEEIIQANKKEFINFEKMFKRISEELDETKIKLHLLSKEEQELRLNLELTKNDLTASEKDKELIKETVKNQKKIIEQLEQENRQKENCDCSDLALKLEISDNQIIVMRNKIKFMSQKIIELLDKLDNKVKKTYNLGSIIGELLASIQ